MREGLVIANGYWSNTENELSFMSRKADPAPCLSDFIRGYCFKTSDVKV